MPLQLTEKHNKIHESIFNIPWWGLKKDEEPPEDVYLIAGGQIGVVNWTEGLILYFDHPELISYMIFAEKAGKK